MGRFDVKQIGGTPSAPSFSSSSGSGQSNLLLAYMLSQQKKKDASARVAQEAPIAPATGVSGDSITRKTASAGAMTAAAQGLAQETKEFLKTRRTSERLVGSLRTLVGSWKNVIAERKANNYTHLYGMSPHLWDIAGKIGLNRGGQEIYAYRATVRDAAATYGRNLIPGSRAIRLVMMFSQSFPGLRSRPDEAMSSIQQSLKLVLGNRWAAQNGLLTAQAINEDTARMQAQQITDPEARKLYMESINDAIERGETLIDTVREDGVQDLYSIPELKAMGWRDDIADKVFEEVMGELPLNKIYKTTYLPEIPYSANNMANQLTWKQLNELRADYEDSKQTQSLLQNAKQYDRRGHIVFHEASRKYRDMQFERNWNQAAKIQIGRGANVRSNVEEVI